MPFYDALARTSECFTKFLPVKLTSYSAMQSDPECQQVGQDLSHSCRILDIIMCFNILLDCLNILPLSHSSQTHVQTHTT